MPTVKILKNKLCKTVKEGFRNLTREKNKKVKGKNAKEKKPVSCLFTTRSLSCREDRLLNFYFTRRENQLSLSCINSEDNSHVKHRSTFYGSFFATPSVNVSRVFVVAETNEPFSHKALVHFTALNSKFSRTLSMESVIRCGTGNVSQSILDTKGFWHKPLCGCKEKYYKFIPFDDSMGEIYTKRALDDKALLNWLDMQAWYSNYLDDKLTEIDGIPESKSDTVLDDINLHCPHKYPRFEKNEMEISIDNVKNHKRFGEHNEEYLNIASKHGTKNMGDVTIKLYIKMNNNASSSLGLCQLKTELVVQGLKTFFSPYSDTMVMWVASLDEQLDKLSSNTITDVFHREVANTDKLKAILFLTEEPAKLLRHKNLGFLDTLPIMLGLQNDEVTILPI